MKGKWFVSLFGATALSLAGATAAWAESASEIAENAAKKFAGETVTIVKIPGPMALEVVCKVSGPATEVCVRQSCDEHGERWTRYYELVSAGWDDSLRALKRYLEQGAEPRLPARGVIRP